MDIEGTTSSIDFVHKELFPFAAKALPSFLKDHAQETAVSFILKSLGDDPGYQDLEQLGQILLGWIKADLKEPRLKSLQGLIWQAGYQSGQLKGHVYPEVPGVLKAWAGAGLKLGIYSSGSVLAQKLIFGYSVAGDLNQWLTYYFDTQIGGKKEVRSYQNIAESTGVNPSEILFLSDIAEELAAAEEAGYLVTELRRDHLPPTRVGFAAQNFEQVRAFWKI